MKIRAAILVVLVALSGCDLMSFTNLGQATSSDGDDPNQFNQPPVLSQMANVSLELGTRLDVTPSLEPDSGMVDSFESSDLPQGLTLEADTGNVSGLLGLGSYTVSITAVNAYGSDTKEFDVTVTEDLAPPQLANIFDQTVPMNLPYSYQVQLVAGTADSYSAVGLPSGLRIDLVSGRIHGVPSTPGSFDVTVRANNGAGSDTQSFSLAVNAGQGDKPRIATPSVQLILQGERLAFVPTVLHGSNLTWSADGLTNEMSVNPSTGEVSGTLSTLGKNVIGLTATNSGGSDTVYLAVHVYEKSIDIDAAWLANKTPPYDLTEANARYVLKQDLSVEETAFVFRDFYIALDLDGNTITYDNRANQSIRNGGFENGSNNWNLAGASGAEVRPGTYVSPRQIAEGGHSLMVPVAVGESKTFETSQKYTFRAGKQHAVTFWSAINESGMKYRVGVRLKGTNYSINSAYRNKFGTINNWVVTPTEDVTTEIQFTVENTGAIPANVYLDRFMVGGNRHHGLVMSGSTDWTGLASNNGENATLVNGAVIQGQASSHDSSPIFARGRGGYWFSDLHLKKHSSAASASGIVYLIYASRYFLSNNTFTNATKFIRHREYYEGYSFRCGPGGLRVFQGNLFDGSPQGGLTIGAVGDETDRFVVKRNVFKLNSKYTNGFAISMSSKPGALGQNLVEENIIDFTDPALGGRGMHSNKARNVTIRHNTVITKELFENQEYGGASLGGSYPWEIETLAENVTAHDNVFKLIGKAGGAALRIKPDNFQLANISIFNNLFEVDVDELHRRTPSSVIRNRNVNNDAVNLTYNEFVTNANFYEAEGTNQGVLTIKNSTFTYNEDGLGRRAYFASGGTGFGHVDLEQPTFADETTRNYFHPNGADGRNPENVTAEISHNADIAFENNNGDRLANLDIEIRRRDDTLVFSGTTDSNGEIQTKIFEWELVNNQATDHNDFEIRTSYGQGTSHIRRIDDLNRALSINIEE